MNNLVVKSNEINAITFYKTSVELKIFSKLILEIRKDSNKKKYRISTKTLMQDINFKEKGYSKAKKIAMNMFGIIERREYDGVGFSVIFTDIDIKNAGYIDFEINENIKQHLVSLCNNFTSYYFENVAQLNSYYSIRIYELLKQYQNIDLKGWWKINISDLRKILKIDNDKYKLYGHFKRKVIFQAKKELEEKTDIKFSIEEHKEGRKVVAVTFFILPTEKGLKNKDIIQSKKQIPSLPQIEAYFDTEEYKILKDDLQIEDNLIKKFFTDYSTKMILKNAKYTLRELNKGNIKTSTGQFMFSALKNNYAENSNSFNSEEIFKKEQEKNKQRQQNIDLIEKLKKELEILNRKRLFRFVEENLDEVYDTYIYEKNRIDKNKNSLIYSIEKISFVEKNEFLNLLKNDKLISIGILRAKLIKKFKIGLDLIDFAEIKGISLKKIDDLMYEIIK